MNHIIVKEYYPDGTVQVEIRNVDTNGVGGYRMPVCDLWQWLWQCRPCIVQRCDRQYMLHTQDETSRYEQAAVVYA